MRALFGVDSCKHGEVYLHGKKVCIKKPEDAIKAGIGFITENRKSEGLLKNWVSKPHRSTWKQAHYQAATSKRSSLPNGSV